MRNLVVAAFIAVYPLLMLWQVVATVRGRTGALKDRGELFVVLSAGLAVLAFGRAIADWSALPPVLWTISLVLTATAIALAGRAWSHLAWLKSPHPCRRLTSVTAQVAFAVAVVVALI